MRHRHVSAMNYLSVRFKTNLDISFARIDHSTLCTSLNHSSQHCDDNSQFIDALSVQYVMHVVPVPCVAALQSSCGRIPSRCIRVCKLQGDLPHLSRILHVCTSPAPGILHLPFAMESKNVLNFYIKISRIFLTTDMLAIYSWQFSSGCWQTADIPLEL